MKENDLRVRTKVYALRIIKLYTALPGTVEAQVLGKQILRSGTSVGAHTAKDVEQNQMQISLTRLRVDCRNWKKLFIGWNYSQSHKSLLKNGSSFSMKKQKS